MKEQELLQELKKRDSEFTLFCETLEYSEENFERFENEITGIQKTLDKLAEKIKSSEMDQEYLLEIKDWFNTNYAFYNTIITLNQKIKENWLEPTQLKTFMILFQLITKFEMKKREVLSYPENVKNLSETISGLHKSQDSINTMYQNLFHAKEDILTSKLPDEKRDNENEEQYKNYIFSYLGKKIEVKEENPLDLIEYDALDAWKIKGRDEGKKIYKRINYLNRLYQAMDDYNKLKKEIESSLESNMKVESNLLNKYNRERENQEIYISEIKRLNENITQEEDYPSNLEFDNFIEKLRKKKFPEESDKKEKPVTEMELVGNLKKAIKEYEQFTGKIVDIKIKESHEKIKEQDRSKIEETKSKKEEPLSEVQLMGNIHSAMKSYERLTGNQVYLKIKDKKKERKGFSFKVVKKANEKLQQFVKKNKSAFYTFGLCSMVTVLGVSVSTIAANLSKQYKSTMEKATKAQSNTTIAIQIEDETLKQLSEKIEKEYNASLNTHIELPFSINNSTFTILPGEPVYKDEYLGLDGNNTARRPYYSSETPRVPESAVIRNKETGEINRTFSDDETLNYLQNNWEVIGANSFDGFYKLSGMTVERERGMKR